MLQSVDAEEIAAWKAYEIVTGHLDDSYEREMLARICDYLMMQLLKSQDDFEPTPRPGRPETKKLTKEEEDAEKQAVAVNLAAALGASV